MRNELNAELMAAVLVIKSRCTSATHESDGGLEIPARYERQHTVVGIRIRGAEADGAFAGATGLGQDRSIDRDDIGHGLGELSEVLLQIDCELTAC